MATFPATSATLIRKARELPPGDDSAVWVRLWDMYMPAIQAFARYKGAGADADDITMRVFAKLVDVLRTGMFDPRRGAFHSYLAQMTLNEVRMQHRKDEARMSDAHVRIDCFDTDGQRDALLPPADGDAAGAALDEDWRRAILAAAVKHVLEKTSLSARDREVYRLYVQEGRPIGEVAAKFGLSRNSVSQIKTRIEKRIAAVGREMSGEPA